VRQIVEEINRDADYELSGASGMAVLAMTTIERLLAQHRPTVLVVGTAFSALVLFVVLIHDLWQPWLTGDVTLTLALGLFFITLLIGVPVGFALLLSALIYLYASDTAPMVMLAKS
jgi:ABC-type proline/glycine betaine transport system permease subunit